MQQPSIGQFPVYTVTSLTQAVRDLVLGHKDFGDLWVEGEISDLKAYPSGHAYFTLKDEGAVIKCMVWSQIYALISEFLKTGEKVLLRGRIDIYSDKGIYQLYVTDAKSRGKGELYARFEELKRRLKAEGLFEKKRGLPKFPGRVGVVTSAGGAVFQDILEGFERRYPCVEVVLAPASVQGECAAKEIAEAIRSLGSPEARVDVIIVARGGGSIEDLWAFNEEVVARALYESPIPTVSAVGHETDFAISDFVADRRAGTASKAAEVVVPDRAELLREIESNLRAIISRMEEKRAKSEGQLEMMLGMLRTPESILAGRVQSITELDDALASNVDARMKELVGRLDALDGSLSGSDPKKALARGFAMVRKEDRYVSSVNEIVTGDSVTVLMKDGDSQMKVEDIRRGKR